MERSNSVLHDVSVALVVLLGVVCGTGHLTSAELGQSQWIGFTQDSRPAEWAARNVSFNRPPADIATWKPTERELRSASKKSPLSPLLRKRFVVDKPVQSARLAICGLGLYELHLNGAKVGDRVLDPAQTSYDKRAFVVVHDVTRLLRAGTNVVGIMLGNGFYGQNISFGVLGLGYGPPRARVLLEVTHPNGSQTHLTSDASWKAAAGPVLFDNIYLGETFDARRGQKDWSEPAFDDSQWQPVEIMAAPGGALVEQQLEPMRKVRKVAPVAVLPAERGWILDLGQNLTGWLQLALNEKPGTVVKLRFAEHLMPNKRNIDTASTGIHVTGADQTDIYICRGGGETWEPRFTYHGFRYVQVEGLEKKPDLKDFTGWLVRTDVETIGTFECSDPLINKFYRVSLWTLEDNLQGILTDCPHRERCAWMGDNHVVAEFASFNLDLRRFWRKTAGDIESVLGAAAPQEKNNLPRDRRAPANIALGKRLCGQARPDWGTATVLVPWFSYLHYGDADIVKQSWPMMVGWMDFLGEFAVKDGLITEGYGDWCPPNATGQKRAPVALTSTALYYQSLQAMRRMAPVAGIPDAVAGYAAKAEAVKRAFNAKFFDAKKNSYGTQTGNAFALHYGLVPEGKEQAVADSLARIIMEDCGGHYATGIFGHRALYTVLNDYGHADVTRHLWKITDYPSLGFLTEAHDLTTWPEVPHDWDKAVRYRRNSFNHPMHSGFAVAFHESLGGIRPDPEHPGFRRFFLKPCFLPGLDWAKATHRAPHGLIRSAWKRENGAIVWSVTVPENTTARVQLPGFPQAGIQLNQKPATGNTFDLDPGTHRIEASR
jgi:alpha-L-rhamnosidase